MDNRFLCREEQWGYVIQDMLHDRFWAASSDVYKRIQADDVSLPIWQDNPYRYRGSYLLGNLPAMDSLRAPLSMSWSITAQCNSHCRYCCTDSINHSYGTNEAGIREIENILSVLLSWNVMRIIIGGGEPLIRPDISEIFDLFKDKCFSPVLATNGILLMGKMLEKAADSCMNLQISLDTLNSEKYLFIRGNDQHKVLIRNICEAAQTGRLVRIVTVLTQINKDELTDIAAFLGSIGIHQWFIFEMLHSGRGRYCYEELHYSSTDKIRELIHDTRTLYPDLGIWYWGNKPYDGCSAYILPNGRFELVNYHTGESVPFSSTDLDKETLQKVWDNIPADNKAQILDNFLSQNRIEG